MAENETPDEVVTMTLAELREQQPNARRIFIDPSTPTVTSIFRFVAITLLLLFVAGFVQTVLVSLTYLFFMIVLSVFFAYLIDPLVRVIQTPFELSKFGRFMPRSLAIILAYGIVFTILGVGIANIAPRVVEQAKELGNNLPSYSATIRQRSAELTRRF